MVALEGRCGTCDAFAGGIVTLKGTKEEGGVKAESQRMMNWGTESSRVQDLNIMIN